MHPSCPASLLLCITSSPSAYTRTSCPVFPPPVCRPPALYLPRSPFLISFQSCSLLSCLPLVLPPSYSAFLLSHLLLSCLFLSYLHPVWPQFCPDFSRSYSSLPCLPFVLPAFFSCHAVDLPNSKTKNVQKYLEAKSWEAKQWKEGRDISGPIWFLKTCCCLLEGRMSDFPSKRSMS